jgi:hypothetical protein
MNLSWTFCMISIAWFVQHASSAANAMVAISPALDSATRSTTVMAETIPALATRDSNPPPLHTDRILLSHHIPGIPVHSTPESSPAAVPIDSSYAVAPSCAVSPPAIQTVTVVSTSIVTSISVVTTFPPLMTSTSSVTADNLYCGIEGDFGESCYEVTTGFPVYMVLVQTSCACVALTATVGY